MKTLVKIIWFSLTLALGNYVIKYFQPKDVTAYVNATVDKLNAYSPINLSAINFDKVLVPFYNNLNSVVFFTLLFLGLDLINGELSGLIKGPIKLLLNSIMYILGFTIIFMIIGNTISITF